MIEAEALDGDVLATRERPSRHGKLLGEALAMLSREGRKHAPADLPATCVTCAFRAGSMPNQIAATGLVAFNCVVGIDDDEFACHHGMKDGEPQRLCVGYVAARLAPFAFTKEVLADLVEKLDAQSGPDEVRAAFDAWLTEVDPEIKNDEYRLAREFARAALGGDHAARALLDKEDGR